MKNKIGYVIFLMLCMILCIAPFAGMAVARTDTTTENKRLAEFPILRGEDGAINTGFMSELGAYFEDHFAFRPQLVAADSLIQSRVFHVSNADTVIVGTDGWLYYASTLDDYLGQNQMSGRAIYCAAHNLALMQEYVTDQGTDFLLTIPPNKNSLYGSNMPYYDRVKVSSAKNIDTLTAELEKQQVEYLDLFSLFEEQDEVLYLLRDSHWNNDGAVLAYNAIFDALDMEHDPYSSVETVRAKDTVGDLNSMLYPLGAKAEWNTSYHRRSTYEYVSERAMDVEDPAVRTYNGEGEDTLVMFRDSFGNTLLPLAADAVEHGYFYKTMPYNIAELMESAQPDAVVVEKVERNICDFAKLPPIMPGPDREIGEAKNVSTGATLDLHLSENNILYYEVAGLIDEGIADMDSNVYVQVTQEDSDAVYEAFLVADDAGDYGYLLYLPQEEVSGMLTVSVYVETEDGLYGVQTKDFIVNA